MSSLISVLHSHISYIKFAQWGACRLQHGYLQSVRFKKRRWFIGLQLRRGRGAYFSSPGCLLIARKWFLLYHGISLSRRPGKCAVIIESRLPPAAVFQVGRVRVSSCAAVPHELVSFYFVGCLRQRSHFGDIELVSGTKSDARIWPFWSGCYWCPCFEFHSAVKRLCSLFNVVSGFLSGRKVNSCTWPFHCIIFYRDVVCGVFIHLVVKPIDFKAFPSGLQCFIPGVAMALIGDILSTFYCRQY